MAKSAFGENKNGFLGLGHNNVVNEPNIVYNLCNKQIIKICFGYNHCIALSKTGLCFSWGNNSNGQLGNGTNISHNKPKFINTFINECVVNMSCGYYHSIVLTQSEEVYGLGQIGCNNLVNQLIAIIINRFNGEKVTNIWYENWLALTESEQVFSWGYNYSGQTGRATTSSNNIQIPTKVNLNNILIKKVICGPSHCLLLTTEGHIYAFGANDS